jgi:hypothetical protein
MVLSISISPSVRAIAEITPEPDIARTFARYDKSRTAVGQRAIHPPVLHHAGALTLS